MENPSQECWKLAVKSATAVMSNAAQGKGSLDNQSQAVRFAAIRLVTKVIGRL